MVKFLLPLISSFNSYTLTPISFANLVWVIPLDSISSRSTSPGVVILVFYLPFHHAILWFKTKIAVKIKVLKIAFIILWVTIIFYNFVSPK